MKIVMNGKEVAATKGQTILEVARANGVRIPTLCHHPGLEPAGMCRLCTVEVDEGRGGRLVTACNYPLRRDAHVNTETERVRHGRKVIIELLWTRCPDSPRLKKLAEEYGADVNRFPTHNMDCVVCGLCARVCDKVGGHVLTLSGRGVDIRVSTAFGKPAPGCIGCLACVQICPVQRISYHDDEDGSRVIVFRGKERSHIFLRHCESCGKYFGPLLDLEQVMERAGEPKVPAPNQNVCPECSRRNLAARLAERHFEQYDLGEEA